MKFNNDKYEVIKNEYLESEKSDALLLRHRKSGARICVLSNDDENKVFYIGFRTPPRDNCGTPHIIEHTVLCGSRKFPLKDPFIELVKGSMNTFLNAMTYPDKTVYPVASCNDRDFANLMDVYLDSVFHPNIYSNINIFRQEGWHYELENREAPLTINGVVYNEMKGAFSSPDSVMDREIMRSLYPDTEYRFESGGDPDEIPNLTYEEYLDFHRTYYHPSNSWIYLYGNMDVEERLDWLDRAYLSEYDSLNVSSELAIQKPFAHTIETVKEFPIGNTESEEKNSYLASCWSVGAEHDKYEYIAFDMIDQVLLSSQGSPIRQALVKAGIGDEIYGGFDGGIQQPYFAIIAKHVDAFQKDDFVRIIDETLRQQVEQQLDRRQLLSALNSMEFRFREGDYGRFPKGLMIGLQLMDSWLYDENEPFLLLDELNVFDFLRSSLDTDYYERLVRRTLVDNPHRSIVTALPKRGLNTEKDNRLTNKLQSFKLSLSEPEVTRLMEEDRAVRAFGAEEPTQEALDSIPVLTRDDMKKTEDAISNEVREAEGTEIVFHNYDTNGITYVDFIFDLAHVPQEMLSYVGVFQTLFGKLDTDDYSYRDLTAEIGMYTGGLYSEINVFSDVHDPDYYMPKFEIRIKVLTENVQKAVQLAKNMMLHVHFDDANRIRNVLAETRSRMRTDLSENGHTAGISRALAHYKKGHRFLDLTGGISYYQALTDLTSNFDERWNTLQEKLKEIGPLIFCTGNLMVSVTGTEKEYERVAGCMKQFRNGLSENSEFGRREVSLTLPEKEAFADASMIQYVTVCGRYDNQKFPYCGAMRIYKSIMNYDYLWTKIRVEGGAYGCSADAVRNGDIFFTSYRDPQLTRTLDVYRNTPDYLKNFNVDERAMTKFVIGTFSELDMPLTPCARGRKALVCHMAHITQDMLQKTRDEVLHANADDIRALSDVIADGLQHPQICVIGNEDNINQNRDLFDKITSLGSDEEEV